MMTPRPASVRRPRLAVLAFVLALTAAADAGAKNHLWRFTEFFSNADGTIQFIEMQECCGSDAETRMSNTFIASDSATYPFPNDLSGPTGHRWILIATAGFASLPGAPTPDYVMPDGFFDPAGDTLRYRGMTDVVDLLPGALPLDGVQGLDRDPGAGTLGVAVNSPINFAGETGSVTVPPAVPGLGAPIAIGFVVGLAVLGGIRLSRRPST